MARQPKPSPMTSPLVTQRFVTRNSEYLVRGGVCFEVRQCQSASAVQNHRAVSQRIVARIRPIDGGGQDLLWSGNPEVGESLVLGDAGQEILTSAVRRIEVLGSDDRC